MEKQLPDALRELYEAAKKVREKAYSPYSGHKVGAAVKTSTGKIFTGCNIENSSYGATNCAERVAIQNAISNEGNIRITDLLVLTDATPPWPPCGMCRQVIAEFADKNLMIHSTNLKGNTKSVKFSELLPEAFTPDYLTAR